MTLDSIYCELLAELRYNERASKRVYHPLFYVYPYGLRFEAGLPELIRDGDYDEYVESAIIRGKNVFSTAFSASDDVLVIFETTPDTQMKTALRSCQLQRIRAELRTPFPEDEDEDDGTPYFYRYLYRGHTDQIPWELILERIVKGAVYHREYKNYDSSVYFYNRTKKLLFHMYDDRGIDLIASKKEQLLPYYIELTDMLLEYDRAKMDAMFQE